MKLIDVEKLEKYKADCCVSLTEWQEGWNDAIDTIMNETPTVEAIPVEWLRQWFAENGFKFYDDNDNIYLVTDIEEMLLEWEEENEVG